MKTVFRNFLGVFRRFRMATALNVAGLSVAFAAFMIIMSEVSYERGFDRSHPNADRIFRVDLVRDYSMPILPRAMVDAVIASSPHIEAGSLLTPVYKWMGDLYLTAGDSTDHRGFREPVATCYPEMTRIFGFRFVEGDAGCLDDPDKIIIPQSMARRIFGNDPATGQVVHFHDFIFTKGQSSFTVGGVYRDFPGNTQLDNVIYTAIDRTMIGDWRSQNFFCYILLDSPASAPDVERTANSNIDFSLVNVAEGIEPGVRLLPLTGLYYAGGDRTAKSGSANTMRILAFLAFLIVAIAAVNFTNFSIAMTPMRIRGLNTRRILGSTAGHLRRALLGEALIVAALAWAMALFVTWMLHRYGMLPFIDADTDPMHNLPLTLLTGAVALVTGLVAGVYPAWYMTSFKPASTLKGSFALSPAGRTLRTLLTGFQYVISSALIITALFVQIQNRYMRDFDSGFDRERIAIVELNAEIYNRSRDTYVNRLLEYPGVDDVAFSKQKMGASDVYTSYQFKYLERMFGSYTLEVSNNFLRVMGIPVVEGRDFMPSDEAEGRQGLTFIVGGAVHREMQIEPGHTLEMIGWRTSAPVAGSVGTVKFTSLRQEEDPLVFVVNSHAPLPVSYIRLRAGIDVAEAVTHIRRTVASIDPAYPVDVEFYDHVFDTLYSRETALNRCITLLSLLAIIISVAGVFGLVLFETEYRRKEISLRKIHGATTWHILAMFNRTYFRILAVCFVLAAPAAWYGVARWLENFAYKTPLYWWVFALAFVFVTLVTLATVTFRNWQAANANPIEGIRTE
jgi:putative ABC transport system permease protein